MQVPIKPIFSLLALASFTLAIPRSHNFHRASPLINETWQPVSQIPLAPRQEHVTVALNDTTLAIVGGIIPDPTANSTSNSTGFVTTNIVQLYDIPTDTWTSASPAPIAINHANAAGLNGQLYILGGLVFTPTGESDQGSWVAIPDAWVYDPTTDRWSDLPRGPEPLARGAAVTGVFGSQIFLAGGLRVLDLLPVTGTQDTVANVTAFDTATNTWLSADLPVAAQQLPEGRDHAVSAVVGSTFYVLGGRNRGQTNVADTVFALDLEDLEAGWRTSTGRMPTARGGLAAGTVGSLVYTFGGEGNQEVEGGVFNETEVFDTVTETWASLLPMAVPRHGTSAVAVGEKIYVPGGGIVQGATPVNYTDVFVP